MSLNEQVVAQNIRAILLYISTLESGRFRQEDFALLCGVHLKSVNKWANGREITRNALGIVADGVEKYFLKERVRVMPEDVAAAGVRYLKMHALRHTAARMMVEAGLKPHQLREVLHASLATTLQYYVSADRESIVDAARRIGKSPYATIGQRNKAKS